MCISGEELTPEGENSRTNEGEAHRVVEIALGAIKDGEMKLTHTKHKKKEHDWFSFYGPRNRPVR